MSKSWDLTRTLLVLVVGAFPWRCDYCFVNCLT